MSKKIIKYCLIEAGAAIIYVGLVVGLMNNSEKIFDQHSDVWAGVAMLLLLVFSVAVMGLTIFGRSIIWYVDGQKKEALRLIFCKLAFLLIIILLVFLGLVIIK
ncbi:MAG: hypothetical protein WC465_02360 [Patescibacteria group bacterium]